MKAISEEEGFGFFLFSLDSAPMLMLTTDRFNVVNQSLLYALPLVADHV